MNKNENGNKKELNYMNAYLGLKGTEMSIEDAKDKYGEKTIEKLLEKNVIRK